MEGGNSLVKNLVIVANRRKFWKMDVKWKFISDCQHETKIVAGNASVDMDKISN
jgi:hypothetical protein